MEINKNSLTQSELKRHLTYDPDTGYFRWIGLGGKIAGSYALSGYLEIRLKTKLYRAARLAWLYHYGEWPKGFIDHRNSVRDDNRIINLRDVTKGENNRNRLIQSNNQIGLKGVSLSFGKYAAEVAYRGVKYRLGRFDTPEEAYAGHRSNIKCRSI